MNDGGRQPVSWPVAIAIVVCVTLAFGIMVACDKMALTAPTESTITLFSNSNFVPINGTAEITANVIESAGTPVQNGTVVSFTTTVGLLEPNEARTQNGKATARLNAGATSGTARVIAFSGGASSEALEIAVGGTRVNRVLLGVSPGTVPTAGGTVLVTATVLDEDGNPVSGVTVTFSASAGRLSADSVVSNSIGQALTQLTTNQTTEVTASAGGQSATVTVQRTGGPTVAIALQGTATVDEPAVFNLTVTPGDAAVRNVTINWGDGSTTAVQQLGAISGSTVVTRTFDRSGNFSVMVIAEDTAGNRSETTTIVNVAPRAALSVNVTASPTNPNVNAVVAFTANVTPATRPIARYEWEFGDGQTTTTTGNTTTHPYSSAGTKTVRVTVVAADGTRGTGITQVQVGALGGISVTLAASSTNPNVGATVNFTATVSAGTTPIDRYVWNFGDGSAPVTTTGPATSTVYGFAGVKTATVTVHASDGRTGFGQITINVVP